MRRIGGFILFMGFAYTILTTITYFSVENVVQISTPRLGQSFIHAIAWSPFAGMAIMVFGAYLVLKSTK